MLDPAPHTHTYMLYFIVSSFVSERYYEDVFCNNLATVRKNLARISESWALTLFCEGMISTRGSAWFPRYDEGIQENM